MRPSAWSAHVTASSGTSSWSPTKPYRAGCAPFGQTRSRSCDSAADRLCPGVGQKGQGERQGQGYAQADPRRVPGPAGRLLRNMRGATQIWGYDPVELLPWTVIKHLLTEHWDGAHDPTLIDGQEGP
jgi:hypothetical protein